MAEAEPALPCPRCAGALARRRTEQGLCYACPQGHGQWLSLAVARRRFADEVLRAAWQGARSARSGPLGCPACARALAPVLLPGGAAGDDVQADACVACQALWLDAGEAEALPAAARAGPLPGLTPLQAQAVAQAQVAQAARQGAFDAQAPGPQVGGGRWLAGAWGTGLLVLVCIGGTLATLWGGAQRTGHVGLGPDAVGQGLLGELCYLPQAPWDRGGLRWLTSLACEPSPQWAALMVALMLLAGPRLEREAGRLATLGLLLAGHLAGLLGSTLAGATQPACGAGAAVAAWLACSLARAGRAPWRLPSQAAHAAASGLSGTAALLRPRGPFYVFEVPRGWATGTCVALIVAYGALEGTAQAMTRYAYPGDLPQDQAQRAIGTLCGFALGWLAGRLRPWRTAA